MKLLLVLACLTAAIGAAALGYDTLAIALAIAAGVLVVSLVIRR